jgi:hypothetical protein
MTRSGLRVAAGFAVLSAITTFLLWLLPRLYATPQSFEEAVSLHQNQVYMARLWVNFAHIFFALIAYGAAAWLLHRAAPALAGFGYLWFVLWGFTELLGVTVNIFAVNRTWRTAYAGCPPEQKAAIRTNIEGFAAVWDAMFFLLLVAFLLGTLCFGLAALRTDAIGRWVGILFLLAVPLTIGIMVDGYTQVRVFGPALGAIYPVLQPVSRALLGYWLWRRAGG